MHTIHFQMLWRRRRSWWVQKHLIAHLISFDPTKNWKKRWKFSCFRCLILVRIREIDLFFLASLFACNLDTFMSNKFKNKFRDRKFKEKKSGTSKKCIGLCDRDMARIIFRCRWVVSCEELTTWRVCLHT